MQKSKKTNIIRLTQLAILIALVVVLQLFGSSVKIGPTSISLVLIPIALGGMLLGPRAGALLGFVFGAITLIAGITGTDPFTFYLLNSGLKGAIVTPLICLGKATLAGFGSAWCYKLLKSKAETLGVFAAAAAAPILNTGLFILGALSLSDVLAAQYAQGTTVLYFLLVGCAGLNFVVELLVNLIAAPAIHAVIGAVRRHKI